LLRAIKWKIWTSKELMKFNLDSCYSNTVLHRFVGWSLKSKQDGADMFREKMTEVEHKTSLN